MLDLDALVNVVQSHALASGHFDTVNGHEPKKVPGSGVTCAVWLDRIDPVPAGSGLSVTTGRVTLMVRLYTRMLAEPPDAIDPAVVAAVDALFAAYSGDFTFGQQIRNVDLLGQAGLALSGRAGYLTQDGTLFRIFDVVVPLLINDLWEQAE